MERFQKLGSNGYAELFNDGEDSLELLVGAGLNKNNRHMFSSSQLLDSRESWVPKTWSLLLQKEPWSPGKEWSGLPLTPFHKGEEA